MIACKTCGNTLAPEEAACSRCGTPAPRGDESPNLAPSDEAPSAPTRVAPADPEVPPQAMSRTPFVDSQIEEILRKSYLQLRRKNPAEARKLCEDGLKLDPDDASLHDLLGQVLDAEGDDIGAYREYRRALELGHKDPATETRLAQVTLRMSPATLALLQPSHVKEALPSLARERLPAEARKMIEIAESPVVIPHRRQRELPGVLSIILPGLGQVMNREYLKAAVMFVVWAGCLVFLVPAIEPAFSGPAAPSRGQTLPPSFWAIAVVLALDYMVSIVDAVVRKSHIDAGRS